MRRHVPLLVVALLLSACGAAPALSSSAAIFPTLTPIRPVGMPTSFAVMPTKVPATPTVMLAVVSTPVSVVSEPRSNIVVSQDDMAQQQQDELAQQQQDDLAQQHEADMVQHYNDDMAQQHEADMAQQHEADMAQQQYDDAMQADDQAQVVVPVMPAPTVPRNSTKAKTSRGGAACPQGCMVPPPGCTIKGNISFSTGERIYHVPGGQFYASTIINPEQGERWFCTAKEAVANGWRASKR